MSELLLDRARSSSIAGDDAGLPRGRPPRNKGMRYPADPPKVEEIVAVMGAAGEGVHGRAAARSDRDASWRAGLRVQEALSLAEADLDSGAAPCWSVMARAAAGARSGWTTGRGSS